MWRGIKKIHLTTNEIIKTKKDQISVSAFRLILFLNVSDSSSEQRAIESCGMAQPQKWSDELGYEIFVPRLWPSEEI